jgi:hypothetical protein
MISLTELSPLVASEYTRMTSEQKALFETEFTRRKKESGKGWLFWFFGFHYLYFGDVGKQLVYWFTLGGLGVWIIMDAVNMQKNVDRYNQRISNDALSAIQLFTQTTA